MGGGGCCPLSADSTSGVGCCLSAFSRFNQRGRGGGGGVLSVTGGQDETGTGG